MTERPLDCYSRLHNMSHSGDIFITVHCVYHKYFVIASMTFFEKPHILASNYLSEALILLFGKS